MRSSTRRRSERGAAAGRARPGGEGAGRVVVDFVYAPRPTPLVEAARRLGFAAVDGAELLVRQGTRQFEALTGRPAPRAALERACRERLDRSAAP